MRKVRWGVLGAANIALTAVIPALQRSELNQVVAIASRSAEKARSAADRLGIARSYGSYEALLADPDIDAIYNPLPNHLHVPLSLAALAAGKHVLCEKPVALNAREAMSLVEAAERSRLVVAEAFMVRHHPQWRKAKSLVDEGRIGEIKAVQTLFSYHLKDPANVRNQAEIGGGGLYDVGCYAIATARLMFGSEPSRAIGLFDMDPAFGTDRMMSGLCEFPEGRHLVFTCGTQLSPCQKVTVLGSTGRIELAIPFNAPADVEARLTLDDGRDLLGAGAEVVTFPLVDQYAEQGDAFARAVLAGSRFDPPIADALANMRVIDAFFRSGRSGAWEQI